MAAPYPLLNPAKSWGPPDLCSTHATLWHGCTSIDADNILRTGVDPTRGRVDTDFGRGFYTTTFERQARHWAWARYYTWAGGTASGPLYPVVMKFRIERVSLSRLETLAFVSGHYNQGREFWSLVQWCRSSTPVAIRNHKCTSRSAPTLRNWYDVVVGPVASNWTQRAMMSDADQIGFHTQSAADLLNDVIDEERRARLQGKWGHWVDIQTVEDDLP